MLTRLSIRNIVLIEALDLDFARGLGVLTGETGAGKSILLDALGLVLGDRAETMLVRAGEPKASVTASFEFAQLPPIIAEALDDADIQIEPGEPLLIRRQVKADGGSKAFVNDQSVSVAMLRQLAPALVELHGQHDDRGLVNPRGHLALLDRYGGTDLAGLSRTWKTWAKAEAQLSEARAEVEQAKTDQDLLIAHLTELTTLEPQAGEEARLAAQRTDMQKGERLAGELEELRHIWEGSDSPLASLRVAARRLDRIAPEHALLAEALAALDRAVIEAGEAEEKLEAAAEALIHDPQALDAAETRLFELRALARKHRCEVDELPELMRDMRRKLDAIEGGEAELDALEVAAREGRQAYLKAAICRARRADQGRKTSGQGGGGRTRSAETRCRTFSHQRDDTARGSLGRVGIGCGGISDCDQSGCGLCPAGQDRERRRALPLHPRAQSGAGGEGRGGHDHLRRDRPRRGRRCGERDWRTSGAARPCGGAIARRDPQPASRGARGGQHYLIAKASSGTVTKTSVVLLDASGRQEEIARMLSGAEVTPEARAQADRLLEGV